MPSLLSVVVPVFRNRETLRATFEGVLRTRNESFPAWGLELVFVDDGSDDGSWEEISMLRTAFPDYIRGVKLSRNFGQVSAILAGYEVARGDAIVTLSADLQDPPAVIVAMIKHWDSGCEVVIAHREARDDDLRATVFSRLAYRAARAANPRMPVGGFDYLLLSRRATEILLSFRGRHRFFQGDVLWIGLSTAFVPYARQKRLVGRSAWTFSRKFKYFTDLLLDSSYLPIRLMSAAGIVTALLGLAYAVVIVFAWLVNRTPFEGWAPLMVTQLIIGGLIMAMLGIIGEYLWRIYDDVKTRPMYVVETSTAPTSHATDND